MLKRLCPSSQILLAVVAALLVSGGLAQACEGCVNLEATSTGQSVKMVQAGFSWSVLFFLGVVFTLVGLLVRLIVKACQSATVRVESLKR